MTLCYNTVSDSLLAMLKKLMSVEVFSCFRLVGGTALSLQRGHRRADQATEGPLDFWELKVMDLKEIVANYKAGI